MAQHQGDNRASGAQDAMKPYKVFGLGFHRTGTTSLQTALELLGYRVIGMRDTEWNAYVNKDYDRIRQSIEDFDGFRDMPWPLLYRWLYENIENARFVLTRRDPDSWARSCRNTYKDKYPEMMRPIYGVSSFMGNEEHCKSVYLRHVEEVRTFFQDKNDVFIELDLNRDLDWAPLCTLLGEPAPERRFPHANRRPATLLGRGIRRGLRWVAPRLHRRINRDW